MITYVRISDPVIMPAETQAAVDWALTQNDDKGNPITKDTTITLVNKVCDYFVEHGVIYGTFSYKDLEQYLS